MGERVIRKESDIELTSLVKVLRMRAESGPLDQEKLAIDLQRGLKRRRQWGAQIDATLRRQREAGESEE